MAGGLGLGDGFGLFVHLQSISERVLSARACLLVERMVCLTAERGWNKERRRQRFKDKKIDFFTWQDEWAKCYQIMK